MKIIRIFLALTALGLIVGAASAQTNPQTQITWPRVTGAGVPTATCPSSTNTTTTATLGTPYTNTSANTQYVCSTAGWTLIGSGGGGGAAFPSSGTPCVVTATSTIASRCSTAADIGTILKVVESPSYATIELAVAACGGVYPCQINLSSALTQSTSGTYTIPSGVVVAGQAGGSITPGAGNTLNFSTSTFSGPPVAFFTGAGSIVGLRGNADVEWFGAASYPSLAAAATGADDSAKATSAIASLTGGGCVRLQARSYRFDSTSITTSANGYCGESIPFGANSNIVSNSASANIVTFGNGAAGAATFGDVLTNIQVVRSVHPTGTATGIVVDAAFGMLWRSVVSADSIRGVYLHMASGFGTPMRDTNVVWGNNIVPASAYASDSLIGVYDDSADGNAQNSVTFASSSIGCISVTSLGAVTTGYLTIGTHINDFELDHPNASGCSHSWVVNYTGSGVFDSTADLHLNFPVFDECQIDCISISNVSSAGSGSVSIANGYFEGAQSIPRIVDIENSSGISIIGSEIFEIVGTSATVGIYANGSNFLTLNGNSIQNLPSSVGIQLNATTGSSVNGNTCLGNSSPIFVMTNCVLLTSNSTGNAISGNAASGFITTAYAFDGTSLANDVGLNSCSGGSIGTCVSGVPTGTAPIFTKDIYDSSVISAPCTGTDANGKLISVSCGGGGGGNTTSTSLTTNRLPKANGANSIIDSSIADNGTTVSTTENFTAPIISATTNLVSPSFTAPASGTATGSANFGSGCFGALGSYWTGTVSNTDGWTWCNALGTGANPTSQLQFSHTGSSGVASVELPRLILDNVTSGNCLQATTGGAVIDTGSPCGSGGGSGISGATAGQLLIAGSATTATSSIPLAGAGAGVTTGLNTGVTSGAIAIYTGSNGQITDGGIAASSLMLLSGSQTVAGTKTFSGANAYGTPASITLTNGTGLPLTTGVTGILPVANGGTGSATAAFSGANITALNATQLTTGTVPSARLPLATTSVFGAVECDGTTITCTAGVIAAVGGGTATNLSGGSLGSIPYQSAASTTLFVSPNTTAARQFFSETGTGSVGAAPTLGLIGASDISPNEFIAAAGSVNVLTATFSPAVTSLATGLDISILPNLANTTTTPTLNVNGLGAKTITKYGGAALAAGDLSTTAIASLVYDGTNWQLQNPQTFNLGALALTTSGIITGNIAFMNTIEPSTNGLSISPQGGTLVTGTGTKNLVGITGPVTTSASTVFNYLMESGTVSFVGTTTGSWSGTTLGNTFGNATTNVYNGADPITQLNLRPTINVATTSTTGYVGLMVNVTETSISAGAVNYLARLQVGAADRFTIDRAGYANAVQLNSTLGSGTVTATPGTGVTSVTCQTATCDVNGGTYTVVGGTATTGTFATLAWPTTTTAWRCTTNMNGGTSFLGLGHGVATATGMTVTSAVTVLGVTFTFDYSCQP